MGIADKPRCMPHRGAPSPDGFPFMQSSSAWLRSAAGDAPCRTTTWGSKAALRFVVRVVVLRSAHTNIGAADAKRTHASDAHCRDFPIHRMRRNVDCGAIQINARIERLKVQIPRNFALRYRQDRFDKTCNSCRGFQMPNVCFDCTKIKRRDAAGPLSVDGADGSHFNWITQRSPCPMCFKIETCSGESWARDSAVRSSFSCAIPFGAVMPADRPS